MSEFIHLFSHSEYSIIDGMLRVDELVTKSKEFAMSSIALTDQNNLFALVKFYQAAVRAKVKPIIGCDVYIENEIYPDSPYRLIILCQNAQGYHNLTTLISQSYLQAENGSSPQISKDLLASLSEGLIAITHPYYSDIAQALLHEHHELAQTSLEYWMGVFENRFYLGISRINRTDGEKILAMLVELSRSKSCPIVAINEMCFMFADDFEAHEARVCINQGATLNDQNRSRHYTQEQYFKSAAQMCQLFADLPAAIVNSHQIARRCNLQLDFSAIHLPKYTVPQGLTTEQHLLNVVYDGFAKRAVELGISFDDETYQQRLAIEIKVINEMGFAGYFLIVADFINWAVNNDVPVGPGRGSGAGSLVAYSLKITNLDPIKYGLLFERFLNPERVSMPDFDIDFCMDGRDRVIEYVADKYGRDSVAQIITYGTLTAKSVIRDVGRVLGYSYLFVDKIAKLIPMEIGITLAKALEMEAILKERYENDDDVKTLIDLAAKLEGITRNVGKHAGGVVIAPSALTNFTPLYCEPGDTQIVTQLDKNDVETIGLVKFDFLGLRTLTIIDMALKSINSNQIAKIDIEKIDLQDNVTFKLLQSTKTTAIFQLESRGMQELIGRLKPDCFEDIIALVALFRPGPLQSGMVDDFIDRKLGKAEIQYPHPLLAPILKPTYGVILYQEQVMQIAQELAGYTLGAADLLRRAMGKKKPEEMAHQRLIFVTGAVERNIAENTASYIFDLMEKFAGYGFNKSHSAAYALISYQTAWLKAHYTAYFMAAVLSADMSNTDKIVILIEDCKHYNLKIFAPDINKSVYKFSVEDGKIIYGLGAIKGVGNSAINEIITQRELHGRFNDLFEICQRIDLRKVNKKVFEALIHSGALDSLNVHRAALMENLPLAVKLAEQMQKNQVEGQFELFGSTVSASSLGVDIDLNKCKPWTMQHVLAGEKSTLGLYFSGHPIDCYKRELSKIINCNISQLRPGDKKKYIVAGFIINVRNMMTKKGDRMAFISVDDHTGRQEVAVFADLFKDNKEILLKDSLIIIEGEVSRDHFSGGSKMRATQLWTLDAYRAQQAKKCIIKYTSSGLEQNFAKKLMGFFNGIEKGVDFKKMPLEIHYRYNNAVAILSLPEKWSFVANERITEALQAIFEEPIELVVEY
jgi:DNA polymerase-3 subunit alpha